MNADDLIDAMISCLLDPNSHLIVSITGFESHQAQKLHKEEHHSNRQLIAGNRETYMILFLNID